MNGGIAVKKEILPSAAALKTKMEPRSRAEIDAWTAKLLDMNSKIDNHSC